MRNGNRAYSQRRRSKLSTENSMRSKTEFSKIIVIITGLLFIAILLDIRLAVRAGYDVSGYATQAIVTTGGILGASIIFYLNKSKIENLSKGKIRFTLLRLRLEIRLKDLIPEDQYQIILAEIEAVESMLDTKLDGALEEAIQRDIDMQNY